MTSRSARTPLAQTRSDPTEAAVWAVVPVKVLSSAKQRLQACLGDRREGFTIAMLKDVLVALTDSRRVGQVVCVTADTRVATASAHHAVLLVDEGQPRGMNRAIRLGIETARSHGAQRVVVLPADLPLATGREIDRLLLALEHQAVRGGPPIIGLGAAADGRGTNFLSLESGIPFETRFGTDSFRQHQVAAKKEGIRTVLLASAALSFDIDCEKDLQDLISYCSRHREYQCTNSWHYLRQIGLACAAEPES